MDFDGYKLSDRAALAALGIRPQPKAPMKIDPIALARSRQGGPPPSPMAMDAKSVFAPYKYPDEVYPDGMAMDSCQPSIASSIAAWAANGAFHEGQGFFGYAYLAQLMQRAEYRHACEIWAEHAVRKWIKITGGTDAQRKAIEDEFDRLNVRDIFQEWMLCDHSYGRGQMFLDFGDADNMAELVTPLRLTTAKVSQRRPLQRLTVVEPMWSAPGMYATTNPLSGAFYKPIKWLVYGRQVDATRLLTLVSRPVSDMLKPAYAFGGQSLVQLMKPYVDNWLRTRQAVSDMINTYSILALKTDMSSIMGGGGGDDVFNRLDMFNQLRDNRGSFAIDKDSEELENIAVPLSGLDKLQAQSQEQLASVARIPLSIYLQITPSGLNASSDGETRNFYADVHAYQERNLRDPLMTVFDIVQFSLFGGLVAGMTFEFNPLWELDEKEKAEIRKLDAEVDVVYVGSGIVSNEEVRERLSNDETSIYHGVDLTDPAPEMPGANDPKTAQDSWNESDHPRDAIGRFGSGSAAAQLFGERQTVWTSKASGIEYVANPIPTVDRSEKAAISAQQEALEDAMVDENGAFFDTGDVDPAQLKSLQNQVSRKQVLDVDKKGSFNAESNGEIPLVIRGPNGLILVDGNHRANAALLAGKNLKVQIFDYDKWAASQKKPDAPKKDTSKEDDDLLRELLG